MLPVSLPLDTCGLNQFALLAPGVVSPNIFSFEAPVSTFGTGRPFVNGEREQEDTFSLDGVEMDQTDNQRGCVYARSRRRAGIQSDYHKRRGRLWQLIGGVIVETLKSGTNQYA